MAACQGNMRIRKTIYRPGEYEPGRIIEVDMVKLVFIIQGWMNTNTAQPCYPVHSAWMNYPSTTQQAMDAKYNHEPQHSLIACYVSTRATELCILTSPICPTDCRETGAGMIRVQYIRTCKNEAMLAQRINCKDNRRCHRNQPVHIRRKWKQ